MGGVRGKEGKRGTVVWSREGNLRENMGLLIPGGNSLVGANAQMAELLSALSCHGQPAQSLCWVSAPAWEGEGRGAAGRGNLEGVAVLNWAGGKLEKLADVAARPF